MSYLNQRIKKLEEAAPVARPGYGLAIQEEGETEEEAIARVRASKPCRKVFLVQFVEAPHQRDSVAGVPDRKC